MRWVLCAILLLPAITFAEPKPWMQRENPNELGYLVSVQPECPFTQEEISAVLEGEFLRSSVEPVNWASTPDLYLNLDVSCLGRTTDGQPSDWSISSSLGFAVIINREPMLYAGLEYGSQTNAGVGASSIQFIKDTITSGIDAALADFLKANFDE